MRESALGESVGSLSGGNQQKALFAKWLLETPKLLIADEPTRGVDVGAKFGIYSLLAKLAERGMGVLMISSELEEILALSNRIVVMRNGRVAGELTDKAAGRTGDLERRLWHRRGKGERGVRGRSQEMTEWGDHHTQTRG